MLLSGTKSVSLTTSMTEKDRIKIEALKKENERNELLVRRRLIESAEGGLISVVEEFEKGFEILSRYPRTVTIFGSARLPQDHPTCKQAFAAAWALAKHEYAVVTGGGGGVMEAANHGAIKAGGGSIGFNIHLPMEQNLNAYTTDDYRFEHFFSRKVTMTLDASGYVFCGGGFGTLDEFFEIITLVQTGIIPNVPIVLLGTDFWTPLMDVIEETMDKKFQTIDPDDKDLYIITDDIKTVVETISQRPFGESRDKMFERAYRLKNRWIAEGRK